MVNSVVGYHENAAAGLHSRVGRVRPKPATLL